MQKQKRKLCTLLLLCLGFAAVQAQEAVAVSGGDASGSGGSVAYTVGQVAYTSISGTGGSVNQGVQQPYEIFVVGTAEPERNITLAVYPNPTANLLTLQIKDLGNEKLDYQLFDLNGKHLESKRITGSETLISMGDLPAAMYFVRVTTKNKTIQTFKVNKIQ